MIETSNFIRSPDKSTVNISKFSGKNRENKSGVEQTRNETGSEYLKNSSNDFLQTQHINTFLHVSQNVLYT